MDKETSDSLAAVRGYQKGREEQMIYYCVRQRAGPLVKEYRGTALPRYSPDDTAQDRQEKTKLKKQKRTALNRHPTDRLELMLALLGKGATHYILTFDDENLPKKFTDVRKALQAFLRRVERWRGGKKLDYAYAIEGLHGDHRYHLHFVTDYYQLSSCEVPLLWTAGEVIERPVLKRYGKVLGFRYLAEYLTKERSDGVIIPIGRHPWSCSRSLRAKLPEPEIWMDECGKIEVPEDAAWARRAYGCSEFGEYAIASWVEL